jgi:hypothetical protein
MRFQKTIDIWSLDSVERANLQPGQWITAGENGAVGRWAGQLPASLTAVASWKRTNRDFNALRAYYKGRVGAL